MKQNKYTNKSEQKNKLTTKQLNNQWDVQKKGVRGR